MKEESRSPFIYLGGARGTRGPLPLLDQNFFIFVQFLGIIGQIVCWLAPLREILDPLLYRFVPSDRITCREKPDS